RRRQAHFEGAGLLSRRADRARRASVRDAQVPHDVRRRAGAAGRARGGERGRWAVVQDPRGSARDGGRHVPAAVLARRDPAALERPTRPDEPRRPTAAAASRLRAARGLAPQALPRPPGHHGPLADLGPLEPRLRRPRAARLLLPRELVDLARHLDPAEDDPCGAARARRVLVGHVVVTGSAGFVGTHLRAGLGEAFVAFDGDVLEPDPLREAVRGADAVVHLAAESSVAASWHDVWHTWRVNVDGTVNLLAAVSAEQPEARVLLTSTCEVYGNAARIPTPEDERLAPVSPYAASKAAAELACAASGLDVVV